MEKQCLIITPAGDPAGYASGHFGLVYDYVLVPACRLAGFWPERADGNTLGLLKSLLESEIVLCELSTTDETAWHALAVRQALSLPVILVKDSRSQLPFFNGDLTEVVYDESLRIDTVQKATQALGEAIQQVFEAKGEPNTIINRLGIRLTKKQPESVAPVFVPEPLQETAAPKEPALPIISPLPDYVGEPLSEADIERLKVGAFIFHMNYGKGEIKSVRKVGKDIMGSIQFESGQKIILLNASDILRRVEGLL
jgi:hypothetical protein